MLNAYSIDVEEMHTDSPGWRMVVTLTPSVEAEDQFGAALDAADAKRTPEERKTIALQQAAVVEPGSHRDLFAKIIRSLEQVARLVAVRQAAAPSGPSPHRGATP